MEVGQGRGREGRAEGRVEPSGQGRSRVGGGEGRGGGGDGGE